MTSMFNENSTSGAHFQSSESLSQAEITTGLTQLYPSRWNPQRPDFSLMLEHMRLMLNTNAGFKQKSADAWETSVQNATPEDWFVKAFVIPFSTDDVARRDQLSDQPLDIEQAKDRMKFLYSLYHTNPKMWLDWRDAHFHEAILFSDAKHHYEKAQIRLDEDIQTRLLNS